MQNGNLIAKLRIEKMLSQQEMANMLKVGLSTYKLYESNVNVMRLRELNVISNFFNVSLNALLNLTTNENFKEAFPINYKFLKYNIRLLRKNANLTQRDLAKCFNMSVNSISSFETEPRKMPATYLYSLAKKFNVSADYICGRTLDKAII